MTEKTRPDTGPLSRLVEVARGLSGILDLDRLLTAILDGVIGLAGAERGAVLLRGEDGELVVESVREASGRDVVPGSFSPSRTVIDEAIATGRVVLLDDASSMDGYRRQQSIDAFNLRTVLAAPLVGAAETVGLLYVDSSLTAHRFSESDRLLIEAFAAVATVALESARLHEACRERDRLSVELGLAGRIQRSLLPAAFPVLPGYRGAAKAVPAGQIGGDLYDFVDLGGGRTAAIVADVSGKGVPAALSMARLATQLRGGVARSSDIGEVLVDLNRSVLEEADGSSFVTVAVAVLDSVGEDAVVFRCGHPPPLLAEGDGVVEIRDGGSLPLGITEEFEPRSQRIPFRPGSVLLLYTDGVVDAPGPGGEPFGPVRLTEVMRRAGLSASGVVDTVGRAIEAFSIGGRRTDDLTLVAVERTSA